MNASPVNNKCLNTHTQREAAPAEGKKSSPPIVEALSRFLITVIKRAEPDAESSLMAGCCCCRLAHQTSQMFGNCSPVRGVHCAFVRVWLICSMFRVGGKIFFIFFRLIFRVWCAHFSKIILQLLIVWTTRITFLCIILVTRALINDRIDWFDLIWSLHKNGQPKMSLQEAKKRTKMTEFQHCVKIITKCQNYDT